MILGGIFFLYDVSLVICGLWIFEFCMQCIYESVLEIVCQLEGYFVVGKVLYFWLFLFFQYELAWRQMIGVGGLFFFYLDVDIFGQVECFFEGLECFLLVVFWGGYELFVMLVIVFYGVLG